MSGKQSKYSYILYNLIKCMHVDSNTQYTSKWINVIEDTLDRTGLGHIWLLDGSLHNNVVTVSLPTTLYSTKLWNSKNI